MWADTDPTLAIGTTSQTSSTFLGTYSTEGITLSSSASYSSGAVQIGSTGDGYNSNYFEVLSSKGTVEKVSFLISGNGSNKSIQAPVFGWETTATSNTADTYRILDAVNVTANSYAAAQWFTYDFSESDVKCLRIYRTSKNISSTDPEYTGSSTALGSSQTIKIYGIKVWLKAGTATVAPSTPTFTVDGCGVTGGTTTTIASENAQKIYYAWTESATAPEKGAEAYTELSGASKAITIPNESGTKYLHAYGWNNYNTSSTSDIKSAEFTITKDVTAPKTWDFTADFSEATTTALATNFTLKDNGRYESSAEIAKNTDVDLGEYAASVWTGLIISRTNAISAGNLRIMPNGYIQINGGNASFKIKNLKDGDVVKVRCQSANATSNRTFTVTGGDITTVTAYQSQYGFSEGTITKSGNGDLTLTQDNGINFWTIAINEDLPTIADESITIDESGVATYITKQSLDFTEVTDLTAYVVTEVNAAKTSVATEAVTVVPSGTPLLVKGASASIPVVPTDGATVTNLLKASTGEGVQGGDNIFAYSKTNKKFQKVASAIKVPAGKCYLQIDGVGGESLSLDFEEATAVEAIAEAETNDAAPVKVIKNGKLYIGNYNVAGQQVK